MSFLALYDRMDSGVLNARVQLGAQGRADGVLHVRDFYLKNEPAMRQLMSQGAHRADDKGVMSFDPESVRVARLQMNFAWGGGKLALEIGGKVTAMSPVAGLLFATAMTSPTQAVDVWAIDGSTSAATNSVPNMVR